jgi:glucosamine kinase
MIILIADSGSTKTHWELFDTETNKAQTVFTQGINPFYQSSEDIFTMLEHELFPSVSEQFIEKIFFYGAGCSQTDKIETVHNALNQSFPQATIVIEHDLLAAAKATCGNHSGIACILGTGSNSCQYNGTTIVDNIPSLGFMLGDEASGAFFGRKLLQSFFYRELPLELAENFSEEYKTDKSVVLNNVYEKPNPNRYVASFMPFINKHHEHPFIRKIISNGFDEFIEKFILKYEGHKNLPIHFIGSVGFLNQEILFESLTKHSLHPGKILKSPMEGLVAYHLENNAA